MTFGTILSTLLLKPLELIFEIIYNAAYKNTGNPGLAIIVLSLAINFLVLPLYNRADAMQEEERAAEAKLNKWVTHIKKTFHGDERTMMLQTYYRQNHYSPLYVLRGAVSLFLEIPFFIAAYRFLSNLDILSGAVFGPIGNLGKPDGLLRLGGLSINVLPILMTVVNVISSAIFSKDYPLKTKLQLYGMAAFFLVFLYDSPAGLAFYWTLNNVFSLVKTIVRKLRKSELVLYLLSAAAGCGALIWAGRLFLSGMRRKAIFIALVGILLFVPAAIAVLKKRGKWNIHLPEHQPDTKIFLLGAVFLAVLTGLLIPSAVLKASPQEFLIVNNYVHPLWYLAHSVLLSIGLFVLWFGVFYRLAAPKTRCIFDWGVWVLAGTAVINFLFFGTKLGTMSSDLVYDAELLYSMRQIAFNCVLLLAAVLFATLFFVKWRSGIPPVLAVAIAAFLCMSAVNCVSIYRSVLKVDVNTGSAESSSSPHVTLSQNGENVVVIMLDRAMGEYVPYIFGEHPELEAQFSGFTHYSNTVSFGGHTVFASPALYGGYEYTPIEINTKDQDSLVSKQNEALRVMPVLFDDNGFDVTVFDPTYAGYNQIPDLSIYDDRPDIESYNTIGAFSNIASAEMRIRERNRNFFCYGIMKTLPLFAQSFMYDDGQYNRCSILTTGQVVQSPSIAKGQDPNFMASYDVLKNLPQITSVSEKENGTFLMMSNDATHFAVLLDETTYDPSTNVNNSMYDAAHSSRFVRNGRTLRMETAEQYGAYETNTAALMILGQWFDYLRQNGVYDNTRIILVADHGFGLAQMDELILDDVVFSQKIDARTADAEFYYPLLMVKDFNSTGFSESDAFMTNADVPVLATADVIDAPVNPMTGMPLSNAEKTAHAQYVTCDNQIALDPKSTTFGASDWYAVSDSIWEKENWTLVAKNTVLTTDDVE